MSSYTQVGTKASKLSDIMKVKVIGSVEQQRSEQAPPAVEYVPFVPPSASTNELARSLTKGENIRQMISSLPGYRTTNTVNSKEPGIVLPVAYTSPVVTNPLLTFTVGGADGLLLTQLNIASINPKFKEDVVTYCNTHYSGSGTMAALLYRMKKQLTPSTTPKPTEDEAQWILEHFSRSQTAALEQDLTITDIDPEMNFDAHPGAPYFIPGASMKDYAPEILARAENALVELSRIGATKYTEKMRTDQNMRSQSIMMMSAKHDVYAREEYFTKTRPFGVVPGHLRMIFSTIEAAIKPGLHTFLSDDKCYSAYKFSWSNGGSDKMVNFILKRRTPGFYPVSWGDDQLWIVVCHDGSAFLVGPDVSGMDMKVDESTESIFTLWLLSAFSTQKLTLADMGNAEKMKAWLRHPDTKLGPKWYSAVLLMCQYIAACEILFAKQYVAFRKKGLVSGVNCTTLVDLVASGRINYAIRQIDVPRTSSMLDIKQYLQIVSQKCKDLGFPLKDDSLSWQVLYGVNRKMPSERTVCDLSGGITKLPNDMIIGIPFLGQRISIFKLDPSFCNGEELRWLVPSMDPIKLIGNAILSPPTGGDPAERVAKAAAGLVGRGFNAIMSKEAFEVLQKSYEVRRSMGHGVSDAYSPIEGCPLIPPEIVLTRSFPSREWFAKNYAPQDKQNKLSHITLPPPDVTDASVGESPVARGDEIEHISTFAAEIIEEESKPALNIPADVGVEVMASVPVDPPPLPPRPKMERKWTRKVTRDTEISSMSNGDRQKELEKVSDIPLTHRQQDVIEEIQSQTAPANVQLAVAASSVHPTPPPIATKTQATQAQEVALLRKRKDERNAKRMLERARTRVTQLAASREVRRKKGVREYYEDAEDSEDEDLLDRRYREDIERFQAEYDRIRFEAEEIEREIDRKIQEEDEAIYRSQSDEDDVELPGYGVSALDKEMDVEGAYY